MAAGGQSRILPPLLVDVAQRLPDRAGLLGRGVGDLHAELFLEDHDQLNDVEAVGDKIVDEARVLGDLVGLDAEMFDDDLFDAIGSLAHWGLPPLCFCGSPSDALRWLQVAPRAAAR